MEVKEADRVVIAKPVASRPSTSTFRSFSELLAVAINTSPPKACSETAAVAHAIRPKTVRVVKPILNHASSVPNVSSSQAEVSGTKVCQSLSDTSLTKSDNSKSTVVYKPLAKLVSKTTVSLLANMGNFNIGPQQAVPQQVDARIQNPYQDNQNLRSNYGSNLHHQTVPSQPEKIQTLEPLKMAAPSSSQIMEEDPKSLQQQHAAAVANGDRPSYDGYNWRKYGQKQVKGSEYPRSYYKCTHPNCPVKKKVERSFDGQIAEIVYKGEHNHPKPQPPKRSSSATQVVGNVSDGLGQATNNNNSNSNSNNNPLWNEGLEGRIENRNEVGLSTHSTYPGKAPLFDPVINNGASIAGNGTSDNSCAVSGECEERSKVTEADDEPKSKRRKSEIQASEAGTSGEAVVLEPRILVQNSTDTEIVGDGFRWRKYGQKVVKGNPYPRSYYRCTSLKCSVRKHVERASEDPKAFITTYEGKHNHDMPIRNTNQAAPAAAAASDPAHS